MNWAWNTGLIDRLVGYLPYGLCGFLFLCRNYVSPCTRIDNVVRTLIRSVGWTYVKPDGLVDDIC